MAERSQVVWELLDGDERVLVTKSWLPETEMLRWTLAKALRLEGIASNHFEASEAAETATISHGWIGTDQYGSAVETDLDGLDRHGDPCQDLRQMTLAHVRL